MAKQENYFDGIKDLEELERVVKDPRYFIENFCYITTKDATFELLKLNYPQQRLMNVVERLMKEGKPVRIRILKARQMGFSTLISALGFWWATMHENSSYAVVAHKQDSASSIYEKNRVFFQNLPPFLKPQTDRFNSERISFNDDGGENASASDMNRGLRSQIYFGTAGGGELFRGQTILFLHKSEKAFWNDKDGLLEKSLNATVPQKPFSCIIEETTANGYNEFKDDWDRSVRGEDDYVPLFVGWNEMEEYSMTPPTDFEMTEKETALALQYDLTPGQIFWRRYKIANDYKGNELWFRQENPITPEEAFIASGAGVFDGDLVQQGYQLSTKPKEEYVLKTVMMREKLAIWEEPEERERVEYEQIAVWSDEHQDYIYVDGNLEVARKTETANYTIGIDTSGLGRDRNVIVVWHNTKKKMVARLIKKNISERDLAKVVVEIARLYNDALLAPEANFSHSLIDFIIEEGYTKIYLHENTQRIDKKAEMRYGWLTTRSTKSPMISVLRDRISEDPSAIPDREFWFEAEYYLMQDNEKLIMNAAKGHHDDVIMAAGIAHFVSCSAQAKQGYSIKTRKTRDKTKNNDIMGLIGNNNFGKKKAPRLKKGIFTNHA